MKLSKLAGAGLLALMPIVAAAQQMASMVDVYYVKTKMEHQSNTLIPTMDSSGDGFGIKGNFAVTDWLFAGGEYQSADSDLSVASFEGDIKLEQLRLGLGVNSTLNERAKIFALTEYIRRKEDIHLEGIPFWRRSADGWGAHVGLQLDVTAAMNIDVRLGYVDVGVAFLDADASGIELLLGAAYDITERVGVFIDYRHSSLSGEMVDVDLSEWRAGVRLPF